MQRLQRSLLLSNMYQLLRSLERVLGLREGRHGRGEGSPGPIYSCRSPETGGGGRRRRGRAGGSGGGGGSGSLARTRRAPMASGGGYAWALAAGLNAALAAISAKFFAPMLLKYGMVILFNVTMWGCYVNSLKALSSLQATVTNFAANFISSGLAGYFLFQEPLPSKWFAGASLIILGVFILSKSSIEEKVNSD